MKTYTYSEARQRLASLLDEAGRDGEVRIRRQDGSMFVLQPVVESRSPLDVPPVSAALRPGELVAMIREEREQAGARILAAVPGHVDAPTPVRSRRRGAR